MASMKPILNAHFWHHEIESSRALDAVVHTLPHDPPPLAIVRSSKLFRCQQLLLLQQLFSFPFTPSYSDGLFSLDRVIASSGGLNWWATLTARIQIQSLVLALRDKSQEIRRVNRWEQAKSMLCRSLCAVGMRTRVLLSPSTSFSASCEVDNALGYVFSCNNFSTSTEKPWHAQATLRRKLEKHDIVIEAAWNDKCVDRQGRYWNVPETLSLDLVSTGSSSGLRYRIGVHHITGVSEPIGQVAATVPSGALPGTHAQAAVSIENEVCIWKDTRHKLRKPYNLLESHPHATASSIIGGILNANMLVRNGGRRGGFPLSHGISADAFASVGISVQLGRFQKPFLDFSKLSVRLDLGAASDLKNLQRSDLTSSTLEVTLQQQVFLQL